MIIMLYGLPVSGKSTLAKALQDQGLGIIIKSVLTRDPKSTRKFTTASIDETVEKTKKEKDDSYKKLLELAELELKKGNTPILDATFHKQYRRQWVYNLCEELNQKLILIWCAWDDEQAIKEVLRKRHEDKSTKDNVLDTWEQYMMMKSQTESLGPEEHAIHFSVDIIQDVIRTIHSKEHNSQPGL